MAVIFWNGSSFLQWWSFTKPFPNLYKSAPLPVADSDNLLPSLTLPTTYAVCCVFAPCACRKSSHESHFTTSFFTSNTALLPYYTFQKHILSRQGGRTVHEKKLQHTPNTLLNTRESTNNCISVNDQPWEKHQNQPSRYNSRNPVLKTTWFFILWCITCQTNHTLVPTHVSL